MNNIELISYVVVGLIPLIYFIIYIMTQLKRKKNKRNYLYGFIVAIIIALILFVARLFIFTMSPLKKYIPNETTTTTSGEITTKEGDTTTKTTEKKSTTKKTTKATNDYNYDKILTPTGGEVVGKTPKGYEVKLVDGIYYVDGYLVANKTYDLPETYSPGKLNSTVNEAANKMFAAAKSEKGFNLYVASGFRSYSTQKSIYNRYVNNDGQKKADTYSARPGYSEHQTGLAFDVCDRSVGACITSGFDNTNQAKWLSENAYKYGFILRYVKGKDNETGYMYESWHFRYVGTELAEKLYNNGNWITMEDYFGLTSSYDSKPIGE